MSCRLLAAVGSLPAQHRARGAVVTHEAEPGPGPGKDILDQILEVLCRRLERRLEAFADLAIGVANQERQLTDRCLEIGALSFQLVGPARAPRRYSSAASGLTGPELLAAARESRHALEQSVAIGLGSSGSSPGSASRPRRAASPLQLEIGPRLPGHAPAGLNLGRS